MSRRIFQTANFTFAATSDSTQTFANSAYMAIRGSSATQRLEILEVLISGMAAASAPMPIQLARSGLVTTSSSALTSPNSDGPEDPGSSAQNALTYVAASSVTSNGARSSAITDARLNLGLNVFGGILRWNAAPTQQWVLVGNTAPGGETYLSCYQQGLTAGVTNNHIIYEQY